MTVHHAVPVQATLGTSSRFWEHVANLRWSKCCFLVSWVVRRCIIPPQGRSMGGNSRHNLYLCGLQRCVSVLLQRLVSFLSLLTLTESVVNRMALHQLDLYKIRSSTCHFHWRTLFTTLEKICLQIASLRSAPAFQHWTTQHNGTEMFKVPLDSAIFTRSLREICGRSGFCKARQQGKAARIFLLFPTLPDSSIRFSPLLFCI